MKINDIVLNRYSTKVFDATRHISDDHIAELKTLLRFSPSSVNLQPWHFVIAGSDHGKQRFAKGTQGAYAFNESKVLNASHVVLFCVKTDVDDEYLTHLINNEDRDGRFSTTPEFKEINRNARKMFVNIHRNELNDARDWMEKQVYLNIGTLLLGAAALGIDAVPIEGLDKDIINTEFNLNTLGYSAVAMVALGYRSASDFNAKLPKSRLPETEIFTLV
ncbi:oxygen-insensitive NAD(P)H nitroreductase [Plesiomonas sp.]|uniref:oxygen-insensitive NAD(P)H nitroreductase n=1 Tax=Plesiomonas sp. TaxID=2486279 RepID=UPI003F37EDD4